MRVSRINDQTRCFRAKKRTFRNSFNMESANALAQVYSNTMENKQLAQNQGQSLPANSQTLSISQQRIEEVKGGSEKDLSIDMSKEQKIKDRDELIKSLQKSNRMITNQVQLIWQKIRFFPQKSTERRKLVDIQTNRQTLEKELNAAYQWIQIVEKELARHRKRQKQSKQIIEKMKKYKQQLSEREAMSIRLKGELAQKSRQVKEYQKKITVLANHSTSSNQLKILTEQINHLYQVLQQSQRREDEKVSNLKKQYELVKKYERELIEKGVSAFELDDTKRQCIREVSGKKMSLSETVRKVNETKNGSLLQLKSKQQKNKKVFDEMVFEIKLLQKKQSQFQSQYISLQSQKNSYFLKNKEIQQKIGECQTEIEQLEGLSEKLRSTHLKQHRRRQRLKSLEIQKKQQQKSMQKKMQRQRIIEAHTKRNRRLKSLPNPHKIDGKIESKEETTTENTVSNKRSKNYGQSSANSNKFNDKHILGRENYGKKIVEMTLYIQPHGQFISGINVTYENNIKGGDYVWKTTNEGLYKIQSYQCAEGYIRDLFPSFEQVQDKCRLVGVQIQLFDGTRKAFGKSSEYQSKLSQKQYISGINGSMAITSGNLSVIESLGMEIYE